MKSCGICGDDAANIQSAIGATTVCWTCFEARAETPMTIHEAYQTLDRMAHGSRRWKEYRAFINPATCFDGFDIGYVPHIAYLEQKTEQVPSLYDEEEALRRRAEDETSKRLVQMMKNTIERTVDRTVPEHPPPRFSLFQRIRAWITNDWSYA